MHAPLCPRRTLLFIKAREDVLFQRTRPRHWPSSPLQGGSITARVQNGDVVNYGEDRYCNIMPIRTNLTLLDMSCFVASMDHAWSEYMLSTKIKILAHVCSCCRRFVDMPLESASGSQGRVTCGAEFED